MKSRNEITLSIIGLLLILLITIGLSYAYFSANLTGGEESTTITVTGGKMSMEFNGGPNIIMGNLAPQDEPLATKTFTVTGNNTTDLDMGYSLYLVVDENTFSSYSIQYKLTGVNTSSSGTIITGNEELIGIKSGVSSTLLGFGTFASPTGGDKTHTYHLELYFPNMPFDQNENQEKLFRAHIGMEDYSLENDRIMSQLNLVEKINRIAMYSQFINKVYKNIGVEKSLGGGLRDLIDEYEDLLDEYSYEIMANPFLGVLPRDRIESVNFENDKTVPSGVLGSHDVSEKQNGSVMLWYEPGDNPELYKVTIGQNGGVKAPIHADLLFSFLINLKELEGNLITNETRTMIYMFTGAGEEVDTFEMKNLNTWDTSNVTNMSTMFTYCGNNAETWNIGDISSWDTSNVTDMLGMFVGAGENAETWNVGNIGLWNTSKVTDMSYMFARSARSATNFSLNLSSWDMSSVTNITNMFMSTGTNATSFELNLSSWNISKITDLSYMFNQVGYNAETLDINLSNWDTSNVTNMSSMFDQAGYNVTTFNLNLSSWNTSRVKDMSYMFSESGRYAESWSVGDISSWDTSRVVDMYDIFYMAGYNAITWYTGNLANWDLTNLACECCAVGYQNPNSTFGENIGC